MDWELFRNSDGTLDLESVVISHNNQSNNWLNHALDYIRAVTKLSKISSRQVAALVVINAEIYADSKLNI